MIGEANHQISISVVDDHRLFRQGLINLIHQVDPNFKVVSQFSNGREILDKLKADNAPDIVVMDMHMPILNGYDTTLELKKTHPDIGILALSMLDDEVTLIKMLKAGVNGYLSKDVEPSELKTAISTIADKGYYYNEYVAGKLVSVIQSPAGIIDPTVELNEQELQFIELSCSEHTYKMIADKMCLSIKTIDGYRAKLFDKLQVKSRVGLVLFALKHKVVSLENLPG